MRSSRSIGSGQPSSPRHRISPAALLGRRAGMCGGSRIGVIGSGHLRFDALDHATTGAALTGGFENALAARQRYADCGFSRSFDPRPTDRLAALGALLSRPGKPGMNALLNDRALELRKHTKHLEQRPSCWGGCVDRLLFEIEIAPNRV